MARHTTLWRSLVTGSSILTGAAALLAVSTAPAVAGGPRIGVSINFVVPHHIEEHVVHSYEPYYVGHVHFRPHRHAHRIYAFPVHTPGGTVFQPYTYCRGVLIRVGYVPGYDPRYDDYGAGYGRVVFDGAPVDEAWLRPAYVAPGWRRGGFDPYYTGGYVDRGYDVIVRDTHHHHHHGDRYDRRDDRREHRREIRREIRRHERREDRRHDRRHERRHDHRH